MGSNKIAEELPVRLAHRVKELDELPHNLSAMPSIQKVKLWYAQSFEVLFPHAFFTRVTEVNLQELITFPPIALPPDIRQALMVPRSDDIALPESKPNPSFTKFADGSTQYTHGYCNSNGNGFNKLKLRVPMERRFVSISTDKLF